MSATCLSRQNDQANLTTLETETTRPTWLHWENGQANLTEENDQANLTGENELGLGKKQKTTWNTKTKKQPTNQPGNQPTTTINNI